MTDIAKDLCFDQDTLSPVFQTAGMTFDSLLDEVLVLIAGHLMPPVDGTSFPRDMIALTWVCQRLRVVLLSAQNLWAHIILMDGRLHVAATFAARARCHPLHICVKGPPTSDMFNAWLSYLPRARSLVFDSCEAPLPFRWARTEVIDAPLLQTIVIAADTGLEDVFAYTLCSNLLSLALSHSNIDSLPATPALVHLDLQCVHVSLPQIHAFLCHTPLLQKIMMKSIIDHEGEDEQNWNDRESYLSLSAALSPVDLPALMSVTLEEDLEYLAALLHIIPLPHKYLHIFVDFPALEDPEATLFSTWTSSTGANAFIISRVRQFCHTRSGDTECAPTGHVYYAGTYARECATLELRGDACVYQGMPCVIRQDDPLLERVEELQLSTLNSICMTEPFNATYPSSLHLACLSNVRRLVISCEGDWFAEESLRALLTCIHHKHEAERSLQTVNFIGCSEALKPVMHQLVVEGIVGSVVWNDVEIRRRNV
jgi:hypothetical protein